jgi:hypothetical protein
MKLACDSIAGRRNRVDAIVLFALSSSLGSGESFGSGRDPPTIHGSGAVVPSVAALADTSDQATGGSGSTRSTSSWRPSREFDVAEILAPSVWLERCARRISEVDIEIAEAEARRIARDLLRFERTAAMPPEAAVDFVAMEMAKPNRTPFERRRTDRG